jgi:hypothetical protein
MQVQRKYYYQSGCPLIISIVGKFTPIIGADG